MRRVRSYIVGGVSAILIGSALLLSALAPLATSPTVEAAPASTAQSSTPPLLSRIVGTIERGFESINTQLEAERHTKEVAPQATTTPVVQRPVATTPPASTPASNRMSIPSIGLDSAYTDVGLTSTGAIDVPATIVGRWNGSAAPGTPGAGFYDGHTPGVFSGLAQLIPGATITVTGADGTSYTYKVVHRETVPLRGIDMRRALRVYGGAREGINLMTCAGAYDQSLGTYDARLVIYAVRV